MRITFRGRPLLDINLLMQWDAGGPSLVWETSGLGAGFEARPFRIG